MRHFIITLFCFALLAITTTACNTVEGVGEDLSSASRAVKEQF